MRDETKRAFELFIEKSRKLESLSFNDATRNIKLDISWKKGEAFKTEFYGPGSEQIDAFILTFRLFIQDNDRFSFRWLANNALNDPGVSDHWKQEFSKARIGLNEFLDGSPSLQTIIEGYAPPTRADIMYMYIYGDLSHVNDDHREALKMWMSQPIIPGMLRLEFIQTLGIIYNQIIAFVARICEAELAGTNPPPQPPKPSHSP